MKKEHMLTEHITLTLYTPKTSAMIPHCQIKTPEGERLPARLSVPIMRVQRKDTMQG